MGQDPVDVTEKGVSVTHWISRNARFSTSFTLYLRLNLEKEKERLVMGKPSEHWWL